MLLLPKIKLALLLLSPKMKMALLLLPKMKMNGLSRIRVLTILIFFKPDLPCGTEKKRKNRPSAEKTMRRAARKGGGFCALVRTNRFLSVLFPRKYCYPSFPGKPCGIIVHRRRHGNRTETNMCIRQNFILYTPPNTLLLYYNDGQASELSRNILLFTPFCVCAPFILWFSRGICAQTACVPLH